MLHQLLTTHRSSIIRRCEEKSKLRGKSTEAVEATSDGLPPFLDRLIETLKIDQPVHLDPSEIGTIRSLYRPEYTVEQVVREYGDLCQAIMEVAAESYASIQVEEFRILNLCLDHGVANTVTEFVQQRDVPAPHLQAKDVTERLGVFGHELRNFLNTAMLALTVIKLGDVGMKGATATVLDRSLVAMRDLIDRALSEVKTAAGIPFEHKPFSLAELIAEVRLSGQLEAQEKECVLVVKRGSGTISGRQP